MFEDILYDARGRTLVNAASVVALMLTTEAVIVQHPQIESAAAGAGMQGGMDDMGM